MGDTKLTNMRPPAAPLLQLPQEPTVAEARPDGGAPVRGPVRQRPAAVDGEVTPRGDRFGAEGPRPDRRVTGQWMEQISTDPTIGAHGKGAPVRGPGVPQPATERATKVDAAMFMERHRGDRILERSAIANADFFVPGQGQNWTDIVEQALGPQLASSSLFSATPANVELIAEAIAHMQGRSSLEAPPEVVAIPKLSDLESVLAGMQTRMERLAASEAIVRAPVQQRLDRGVEVRTTTHYPRVGAAYEAQWNDTLRGVVLASYRRELRSLAPEQADARLRELMLGLAAINGLQSTDLADAGVIWIPPVGEIDDVLGYLNDSASDGAGGTAGSRLDQVRERYPELWRSIERTGTGATWDLDRMQMGGWRRRGIRRGQMPDEVRNARMTVRCQSFQEAFQWAGFNPMGMFSYGLAMYACTLEPPSNETIPIRREGESFSDYLDRVAGDMSPEEFRRTLENPTRFMLREMGVINGNGDVDPAIEQQFREQMVRFGIQNEQGEFSIVPRPGETFRQAVDRVTLDALEGAGLLRVLAGTGSREEVGARIDEIRSRGIEALAEHPAVGSLDPQQLKVLRMLVGWNQLVLAKAESDGIGPDGRAPAAYSGNMTELVSARSAGFSYDGFEPYGYDPRFDRYLETAEVRHEAVDEDELFAEEDDWTTRGDELRAAARSSAQGAARPNSEAQIAAKRDHRSTDRVIEQYEEVAHRAQTAAADQVANVNQAEAAGQPVRSGRRGGPPPRRGA